MLLNKKSPINKRLWSENTNSMPTSLFKTPASIFNTPIQPFGSNSNMRLINDKENIQENNRGPDIDNIVPKEIKKKSLIP